MANKKFFLDKQSKQVRAKSLEELKKQGIEIRDDEGVVGGASDRPAWLEVPSGQPVKGNSDDGLPSLL